VEQALPDSLAFEDAHATDAGAERLVDEAHDLPSVLSVVAVVDLADEAGLGTHPGDDGAAGEDVIGASPEVFAEGNLDGDGVDAFDPHVGLYVVRRPMGRAESLRVLSQIGALTYSRRLTNAWRLGRSRRLRSPRRARAAPVPPCRPRAVRRRRM